MDVIKIYLEKIQTQSNILFDVQKQSTISDKLVEQCNHQIRFALEQINKQLEKLQIQEPKMTQSCFNCEHTKTQMAIFKKELIKQQTEMMANIRLMQEQQKQMINSSINVQRIDKDIQTTNIYIPEAEQQEFNEIIGLQKQLFILRKENERLGYENDYLNEKIDVTNDVILELRKQLYNLNRLHDEWQQSKPASAESQYDPEKIKDMTKHAKQLEHMLINHIECYKKSVQYIQLQAQQITNWEKQCLGAKEKYTTLQLRFDQLQNDNDGLNFTIRNIIEKFINILKIDNKTIQFYIENEVLQKDEDTQSKYSDTTDNSQTRQLEQSNVSQNNTTKNIYYKPIHEIQNKPRSLKEYQEKFREFIKSNQNCEFTKFKRIPPAEQKKLMLEACVKFLSDDINAKIDKLEYYDARQHIMDQQEQDYQELLQQYQDGNANNQSTQQQNIELQLYVTQQQREMDQLTRHLENKNHEIELLTAQLSRITKQMYTQQEQRNQFINLDDEQSDDDLAQSQSKSQSKSKKHKNKLKFNTKKSPIKQKQLLNKKKQNQIQEDDENSTELISLAKNSDTQATDIEYSDIQNITRPQSVIGSQVDVDPMENESISLVQSQIINNVEGSQYESSNNVSVTSLAQSKKKKNTLGSKKSKQSKQNKENTSQIDIDKSNAESEQDKTQSRNAASPTSQNDQSETNNSQSESESKLQKKSKFGILSKAKKEKLGKGKKLSSIPESEIELSNENSKITVNSEATNDQQNQNNLNEETDKLSNSSLISSKKTKKYKKEKAKPTQNKKLKQFQQPPEQDQNKLATEKLPPINQQPITNQEKPPIPQQADMNNALQQQRPSSQVSDTIPKNNNLQYDPLDILMEEQPQVSPSQNEKLTESQLNSEQPQVNNNILLNSSQNQQGSNINSQNDASASLKSPDSTFKTSSKSKNNENNQKQLAKEQQKQQKMQQKLDKQQKKDEKKQHLQNKKKKKQEQSQQENDTEADKVFLSAAHNNDNRSQQDESFNSQTQQNIASQEVSDSNPLKKQEKQKKASKEKKESKAKKDKDHMLKPALIPSSIFIRTNQESQENKSELDPIAEALKKVDLSAKPQTKIFKEKEKTSKQKKEDKKQEKVKKNKKNDTDIQYFDQ